MKKRWKAAKIISIALIAILVMSHTAMSFASTGTLEAGGQPAATGENTSEVNKIQEESEPGVPEETVIPPSSSESNMSKQESDYLQAIDNASSESKNKVESTSDDEDRIHADKVNSKATSGEKAQELTLDKEKLSIQVGNRDSIKATVKPQDASLKWESSNENVAKVNSDGTVTGIDIGTATITVSSGNLSAQAIVTVSRNTSNDVEQDAYFYIRNPEADGNTHVKDAWYYAGMGTVTAPLGIGKGKIYTDLSMITSTPESYPVITANGQKYTYDDSKNPGPNTYHINWEYIKDETGANNGDDYFISGQAYHVDGCAVLNDDEESGYAEQNAYFYIWKPGANGNTPLADAWYYAGEGKVTAPPGIGKGKIYYDLSMITKYPDSYPDITADGQIYTYDAGENPGPNTYSIKWAYIKDETGANNGNNHFISGQAYHVDGYAVLNTAGKVTVDFKVKNPNSDGFESVDNWPRYINYKSSVTAPTLPDKKTENGVQYFFDGWYKDEACTQKVNPEEDFQSINNSIVFYAKYVADFEISATGYEGVYDGKAHKANIDAPEAATVEYLIDGQWTISEPAITNVGEKTYRVRATLDGTTKTAEFTLEVTPAPLQIIANNANKVQGTENPKFSAQIAGLLGDDGKGALEGVMMFECSADKDSPIGEYIIIPYGLTAENYNIEYVTGVLSVTLTPEPPAPPTAPTITVPVDTPPATPTGTVGGTIGGTAPTPDGNNADATVTAAAGTTPSLVNIEEGEVPMAAGSGNAHWALLNLILTVLTVLMSIVLIALYFTKRREREDEGEVAEQQQEERGIKKKGIPRILSAVWAVLMIGVFFLTEDMSLPMQLTDKWTILMAIMTIVQIVIAFFAKKKYEDNEKDNDLAQA